MDCRLRGTEAEDALNLVQCEFKLEDVEIRDTRSDALDSDFSEGTIVGGEIADVGGDGIDFSGSLVEVDGHEMHLNCEGTGSPIVLLESGQDVRGSLSWHPIKAQVAAVTRVCAYDRAGILWSAPGPNPRTSPSIAQELETLLGAAGETGPYVLVGHSIGGIHMRRFADLDRDAVVGLVFVDSSHPDQLERLPAEMTARTRDVAPDVQCVFKIQIKYLWILSLFSKHLVV